MRAPTPNVLHAVNVSNTSQSAVFATVHYDDHKDKQVLTETQEIAPGQSHSFGSKMLDMGGWQAVAPVKQITAGTTADHGSHASKLTPTVHGIVKEVQCHIGEGLTLNQA
uniref:Uncharacterized protein n=1 Tax=Dunaliella tertiolecta TaxID=3047 RepID=A0A7S3R102_DUNTE|mmetsp:Transcript_8613/g.23155  ORF Transcript_8613/g.23155 Transcript_8613/m.23155 type:complete len:110 (+) Transcript_8613:114-443(+)